MLNVNIAHLKARLSYYLSQVRQGQEVVIFDRKTPIAKVVASGSGVALEVTEPRKDIKSLKGMKFPALKRKANALSWLREDRDRR